MATVPDAGQTASPRHVYYNPRISGDAPYEICMEPNDEYPANLISSLCEDGLHRPALDIDIPMVVVPSATEGHAHLYFPSIELDWPSYRKLIDVLVEVGIVQEGYGFVSKKRGMTCLRPPDAPKPLDYVIRYDDEMPEMPAEWQPHPSMLAAKAAANNDDLEEAF